MFFTYNNIILIVMNHPFEWIKSSHLFFCKPFVRKGHLHFLRLASSVIPACSLSRLVFSDIFNLSRLTFDFHLI